MPATGRIERIGHRGAPNELTENTLPSFRRAVELGAQAVELDVHVSADGVPVVHHDPSLGRLGKAPGPTAELARLTAAEIAAVPLRGDTRIPTLAEVLAALTPATRIYVEIKGGDPEIIATVLGPYASSVAVHGFDHELIARMREIAPEIPRGVLIESRGKLEQAVRVTDARDLWPAHKLVDGELMATARRLGVRVIPWTVNTAADVQRVSALGVAGICTNDLTLLAR